MYNQHYDVAFIPGQCRNWLVNGSSKNILAYALLSLLVFEHGFIQTSFGIFYFFFFFFCFMSNKYYLIPLNFTRYLFSVNTIFSLMGIMQWNLNTKVKVFHESISCFMKWSWNCISWNALKEKFQCVSLP